MISIKKIKLQQKQILFNAIATLQKEYQNYCNRFVKKLSPDILKNCAESIEHQLRWEWNMNYELQDKKLNLALIHFERYEKEYIYLSL